MRGPSFLSIQSALMMATDMDVSWHPPLATHLNNLTAAFNSTGTSPLTFTPTPSYPIEDGKYNWCNMPHVHPSTYRVPTDHKYTLDYVEVIHRHHKRTPYASNLFPGQNTEDWTCSNATIATAQIQTSPANDDDDAATPLTPRGAPACTFPQITTGGLEDSAAHGHDLASVYQKLLHFLPATYDPAQVKFRVTNNIITSQVASALIPGLYPALAHSPVTVTQQSATTDSLEPKYTCPASDAALAGIRTSAAWTDHLARLEPLFADLDRVSGVDPASQDWHVSVDHYYDNLAARLCHAQKLPCNWYPDHNQKGNHGGRGNCISREQADTIFRLGQWEYSRLWRDDRRGWEAGRASFAVWLAELVRNMRARAEGGQVRYRHNVAHDGSVSRLLAALQVEEMFWPGMGAEVAFEVWKKGKGRFLRILWGGKVFRSSSPSLGAVDMIPLDTFLGYVDGLVGKDAAHVKQLCSAS